MVRADANPSLSQSDVGAESSAAKRPSKKASRRRWRRGIVGVCCCYGLLVLGGCMNVTTPVDYLMNLGWMSHESALEAPQDGVRRLVVLRHGLWRSAAALWKLERALKDHGYEVVNANYGSTSGLIQDHARELETLIQAALAKDPARETRLYFVGHSLGGLQIRSYLSMPGAALPEACVFIATPHRGAVLADARKDWWLFKVLMGNEAALQLSPGSDFYGTLRTVPGDVGTIYGAVGDGEGTNDDIPGDDDGTVGMLEAQLPEAVDTIPLPLGHTGISIHVRSIRQVLYFFKHRRFDHSASAASGSSSK